MIGVIAIMSEKIFNTKSKKTLSDPYHGQLVEPKSLNKNEQPPLANPTTQYVTMTVGMYFILSEISNSTGGITGDMFLPESRMSHKFMKFHAPKI